MRSFILEKVATSSPVYNISEARAIIDIARSFSPVRMKEFEELQGQKTNKRKARLQERIDELKTAINDVARSEVSEPVESDN